MHGFDGSSCERCGRTRRAGETFCPLCGTTHGELERPPRPAQALAAQPVAAVAPPPVALEGPRVHDDEERVLGLPEPWFHLGLGALVAPLVLVVPLLRLMAWFLGSLVHEMGHAGMAWLFGMPAFPAIRLDGHAAAFHAERSPALLAVVWIGLAILAWRQPTRGRQVAVGTAALLHPLLVLFGATDTLVGLAGHLAELAFAFLCFGRALTGGFTSSRAERGLYAIVGWVLLLVNLRLTLGLLFSQGARAAYAENGSFGLTNDYLVLARDHAGGSLALVVVPMTLLALVVLPAALLGAHAVTRRRRLESEGLPSVAAATGAR